MEANVNALARQIHGTNEHLRGSSSRKKGLDRARRVDNRKLDRVNAVAMRGSHVTVVCLCLCMRFLVYNRTLPQMH